MDNRDVARILRETANLLEIDGAMIGRYRSYEKAAELIESLPESVEQLAKDPDQLMELPGIGDRMAEHIATSLEIQPDDFQDGWFGQHGSLGRAHQLFGDKLTPLLAELNRRLAA